MGRSMCAPRGQGSAFQEVLNFLAFELKPPTLPTMQFSWFLALRYLKPKRTAFSVITILSILGVMLGVGTLIVVIGVMSGFDRQIKEGFLKIEPHVTLHDLVAEDKMPADEAEKRGFKTWEQLLPVLRKHPRVKAVFPYISMMTLAEPGGEEDESLGEPQPAMIFGLDPENEEQATKLKAMMLAEEKGGGAFELDGDKAVVSRRMAVEMGLEVGGKLNAFSPEMMKELRQTWKKWEKSKDNPEERKSVEEEMNKLLVPSEFEIAGLFDSDQYPNAVFLSLENAQVLSGKRRENWVTGLALTTDNAFEAQGIALDLFQGEKKIMTPNWNGSTWIDKHQDIFNAVQNERSMMYIVLMIITIVAAFSTMISMIIFAVQKKREIGMIRALGAKISQVLMIFTGQGVVVGILGVGLGATAGLLILHYRNALRAWLAQKMGIDIFPAHIYQLPEIPAYLRPSDLWAICLPALILCSVAALLPALFTSLKDPARSLRGER